jgi:hypothetical protein
MAADLLCSQFTIGHNAAMPAFNSEPRKAVVSQIGRGIVNLIRDAFRKAMPKRQVAGPVAIWDGKPKRPSFDHDNLTNHAIARIQWLSLMVEDRVRPLDQSTQLLRALFTK